MDIYYSPRLDNIGSETTMGVLASDDDFSRLIGNDTLSTCANVSTPQWLTHLCISTLEAPDHNRKQLGIKLSKSELMEVIVGRERRWTYGTDEEKDLEAFGITEELRDFANGITPVTFRDFPIPDDTKFSDVRTVTNVRQDLTEWQTKHATLVLSTVKEISKLRYELCPRVMTERKFWRMYFILVNNHVAPYEKRYLDNVKLMSSEQFPDDRVKEPTKVEIPCKAKDKEEKHHTKTSTSSTTEQDLDAFLLGDSDDDPDDGDGNFDDDFDKLVDGSDEEKNKL